MDLISQELLHKFETSKRLTPVAGRCYDLCDIIAAVLSQTDNQAADGTDIGDYEVAVPAPLFYNYMVRWSAIDRPAVEKKFPGLKLSDEWLRDLITDWRTFCENNHRLESETLRGFTSCQAFYAAENNIGLPDGIALAEGGWQEHVKLMIEDKDHYTYRRHVESLHVIYDYLTRNGHVIPMPKGYGKLPDKDTPQQQPATESLEQYIAQLIDKIAQWYGKPYPVSVTATPINGKLTYSVQVIANARIAGRRQLGSTSGDTILKPLSLTYDTVNALIQDEQNDERQKKLRSIDEKMKELERQREQIMNNK